MHGLAGAPDRDGDHRVAATGNRQRRALVLGQHHRVAGDARRDHGVELLAIAPRRLVQVVRGQQQAARRQAAGVAHRTQRLHRRGDPGLHVGRAAAGQHAARQPRRPVRQVDGVQVAVELQGRSGPRAGQPRDHGRGIRMACGDPLHLEAVSRQQLGQPVGRRSGLSRGAGELHQRGRRCRQAVPVNRVAGGVHGHDEAFPAQLASSSSWTADFTPVTTDTTPSRSSSQRTAWQAGGMPAASASSSNGRSRS